MATTNSPQVDSSVLNQANQSSTEKQFSVELGITSIQNILIKMSESVEELNNTDKNIFETIEKLNTSWTNRYLRAEREKRSILNMMNSTLKSIENIIVASYADLTDFMSKYFTVKSGAYMPLYISDSKYLSDVRAEMNEQAMKMKEAYDVFSKEPEIIDNKEVVTDNGTLSFREKVLEYLKIISEKKSSFNFLSGNFSNNKYEKVASQQAEKPKEEKVKTKINFKDIIEFGKSVDLLGKTLNAKFLKAFKTFHDIFEKFMKFDPQRLEKFGKSFSEFANSLSESQKSLSGTGKALLVLAGGLLAIGVVAILPTTALAIGTIALLGWVLNKTFAKNDKVGDSMFDFAKGIGLIALSMLTLNFVNWSSAIMLVATIGGLAYIFNKIDSKEVDGIKDLAIGVGILSVAMIALNYVQWTSALMMLGFIWGLTKVLSADKKLLRKGSADELPKFAMGIGILTISLLAMNYVNWASPFMLLGFISGLGLVLRIFNKDKIGKMSPLTSFAWGIGVLVLAMVAMNELTWEGPIKMLVFIGALLGLITLTNRLGGGGAAMPKGLPGFAFGLGLMVLAMYAMNELPFEAMFKTLVFIGGLGLSMKLMGQTSIWMMPLVAAGVMAIAYSLKMVVASGITWEQVGMLLTTIGGLAVVTGIMGALGPVAIIGAATMVLIGGSALLLAGSLSKISQLKISFGDIAKFGASIVGLSLAYLVATPFALLGVVGAALFIPIAASALLAAGSLAAIGALAIDKQKIDEFGQSIGSLALAYASNIGKILLGVVASAMFVPIALTTTLIAATLKIVTAINVKPDKLESFGQSLTSLVDTYDSIGIVKAGKVGAKALLLLPMAITSKQIAETLKLLSEVDVTPESMEKFGDVLISYISKMADVINSSVSTIDNCKPGLDAIAKLTNIGFQMLDTIHKMSNLEIVEHEVKDGQLVVKSVRKFDLEKDSQQIQSQMPKILNALVSPIDAMIRDLPRVKKKHEKAAEYIGLIGNSYSPFVDAITKLAESKIATADEKSLNLFKTNLITATQAIMAGFEELKKHDSEATGYSNTVKTIESFMKSLDRIETIDGFNEKFETTIGLLTNEDKWSKAHSNLKQTATEIKDISKAIKTIDIDKATAFNSVIKQLVEANSATDLKQCVEELAKLLGLITETQQQMQTVIQNQGNAQQSNQTNISINNKDKENKEQKETDKYQEMFAEMFQQVSEGLESISNKLGRPLKVVPVTGNANSL